MKKIHKANLYFLCIMIISVILPQYLINGYLLVGIRDIRWMQFLNHMILFLIPAIIYVKVCNLNIKETFKLNKIYFKDFLLVILITIVSYPLMSFIGTISGLFFENNIGNFMTSISSTPYIILMLLMAVTPAITEEVTLRGIVLSGYDNVSRFKSALATGLLFGIFHLDMQQFLYAAVLGFIFAYIVRVTNSIFAAVFMHFSINGFSVTMQQILIRSGEAIEETPLTQITLQEKFSVIIYFSVLIVILGCIVMFLIKKLEKWNIQRGVIALEEGRKSESIFNWSFSAIILVYILSMIFINLIL